MFRRDAEHVHLLIAVGGDMTIERAMPFIKGDSPFDYGRNSGIWERSGSAEF
jgi:hypothetical protein